jgi:DNA-binding MarR family transcriptional regulator
MNDNKEFINMASELKVLTSLILKLSKHDIEQRLAKAKANISFLGLIVLRILYHKDQTISDLGEKMILKAATLVPVIDSLEVRGLVKRKQDTNDRRRNTISLTPTGIKLIKAIPIVNDDDQMVAVLQEIGQEESEKLLILLRKISIAMGASKEISNIANVVKLINS